jgi:hypothetical protein
MKIQLSLLCQEEQRTHTGPQDWRQGKRWPPQGHRVDERSNEDLRRCVGWAVQIKQIDGLGTIISACIAQWQREEPMAKAKQEMAGARNRIGSSC